MDIHGDGFMTFFICDRTFLHPISQQISIPHAELHALFGAVVFLDELKQVSGFENTLPSLFISESLVSLRIAKKTPHLVQKGLSAKIDFIQSHTDITTSLLHTSTKTCLADYLTRAPCAR